MATFEERNPYVPVSPRKKKTYKSYRVGLLGQQDQQEGLLGYQETPTSYRQGILSSQPFDRNAYIAEYQRQYMNALNERQQAKDEAAMQKSAAKLGKEYTKSDSFAELTGASGSTVQDGANATAYYDSGSGMWIDSNTGQGIQSGTQVPAGYTATESSSTIAANDAASGSSTSNTSAYLGAATGALAGYGRGKKNYYTDPAMRSGEDGFGKYHRDYRAEVGGGVLGGVIGYYTNGLGNGFVGPIVDWFHPYAQDMTRDAIMLGDKVGGAYGAMVMDPIGTWASGKYSNSDLVASSLTPMLAPMFGGKAPEVAQKASDPISDLGNSIADVFGW